MRGMTPFRRPWHDQWARIDDSTDPRQFVEFLDEMHSPNQGAAATVPHVYFSLLEIETGHRVLDVGCGTGDETRGMARLVGATGIVIGIDASWTMITEARRRTHGTGMPVTFVRGDAHDLSFPNSTFDRVHSAYLLASLQRPRRVIGEMVRVTRGGGKLTVIEQDWETFIIDSSDHHIARMVRDYVCEAFPSGRFARSLRSTCIELGLKDVAIRTQATVSHPFASRAYWWRTTLERIAAEGLVDEERLLKWSEDLMVRATEGRYFESVVVFTATAWKPPERIL